MMQVELGTDIEKHLLRTAAAQGISVDEILRKALSGSHLRPDTRQNDEGSGGRSPGELCEETQIHSRTRFESKRSYLRGPAIVRFVLDGSTAVSWCFEDEYTVETQAVLSRLKGGEAFVPAIWPTEIANALLTGIKKKRISLEGAQEFLIGLSNAPIRVQAPVTPFDVLLTEAQEFGLTVYDATYLSLARAEGLPLATLDDEMKKAAARIGVGLVL